MKSRKRFVDKNQMILDLSGEAPQVLSLEGGSQEKLSDFEFRLRGALKESFDNASKRDQEPLDRTEIAARMSRLLGREITKSHLDQWSAMSTVQRRIHVDALKAVCEVTDDWSAMKILVESCGFRLMTEDEAACAEFGMHVALRRFVDSEAKDALNKINTPSIRELIIRKIKGGPA